MEQIPLLVITDIGSDPDDAISILCMLNAQLPVKGVYVTNGDIITRSLIVSKLFSLKKIRTDIGLAEALPFDSAAKPYSFFEECHVDHNFIDWKETFAQKTTCYKKYRLRGIKKDGVSNMAKKLLKQPHIILSLAPLTPIAQLLYRFPATIKNIHRLYIQGCCFIDNIADHNICFDKIAARLVFDSEIPITIIPDEICSNLPVNSQTIEQLESPAGLYVKEMVKRDAAIRTAKNIRDICVDPRKKNIILFNGTGQNPNIRNLIESLIPKECWPFIKHTIADIYEAAFNQVKYLQNLQKIIELHQKIDDPASRWAVETLKNCFPKDICLSALYALFCYAYPGFIWTRQSDLEFDKSLGISRITAGDKFEIVKAIDTDRFQEFMAEFLF